MIIRKALKEDAEGKGYVHYQIWLETYTGLIDPAFLSTRGVSQQRGNTRKTPLWPKKTGKL